MRLAPLLLLAAATPALSAARPCLGPEAAAAHPEKEVCLAAHVYQLSQSPDGTRSLDICGPSAAESACRFTVLSLPSDRKEVGELDALVGQDIRLRGTVHNLHGESIMLVSHSRQFHDGPEKFRPNPALLAGFSAESGKEAVKDPASMSHRGSSAFKGSSR